MQIQNITQRYLGLFPGDFSDNPMQRQTPNVLFATTQPIGFPNAKLLVFNKLLAREIGLGDFDNNDESFLAATDLPSNIKTYATAYAGHQFGNWAGQLGDGRAILAGEIKNDRGQYTELQWKGAGATPYSRHADGRAVLRSSVREYLMSEAMYHLRVPTTRALSLSLSGENVVRDEMYNGNPKEEKGAVVLRTSPSFLRFGHFEMASAQKNIGLLEQITGFTIKEYYPEIDSNSEDKYKSFYREVSKRTAQLMVEWMRVGFVHGVINTDNMSILGLTIDYGPYSMLDEYDLNFTPNTTDLPGRRYAFGKQPQIAQWNLWQLANALYPLINDEKYFEEELKFFNSYFWQKYDEMMSYKFGLSHFTERGEKFYINWQKMMMDSKIDYTLFFHHLEKYRKGELTGLVAKELSYSLNDNTQKRLDDFLSDYKKRLQLNTLTEEESIRLMEKTNPKFTLRNYLLYECIQDLEEGNTEKMDKLLKALQEPYKVLYPEFSQKKPATYEGIAGCSMLSCSS